MQVISFCRITERKAGGIAYGLALVIGYAVFFSCRMSFMLMPQSFESAYRLSVLGRVAPLCQW